MKRTFFRPAMAMIEVIFAIVIIAISVLSIPSMISVADQAAKIMTIDDDVMSRLAGWTIDKFQARWDQNYTASGSGPLWLTASADLACNRGSGNVWFRSNPDSIVICDDQNRSPATIAAGDGNISKGIEQLNGGSEPITITAAGTGETYSITADYVVSYVDSSLNGVVNNSATDTWTLGSSTNMNPGPAGGKTHLKRVVTRFSDPNLPTDITLTFFKSNKGN